MNDASSKVVIIGGGLSGLTAAFYIRKFYKEKGLRPEITVLEKAKNFGGKIESLHREGFVIEKGPDSFLARKTAMIDLAKELELDHELVEQNPKSKKAYIVSRNKLHPMPSGLVLGIPTEMKPFITTGLISSRAKLRALLDFVIPARKKAGDESLGHFLERRLGTEVLENVAEPLLAGIYAGETRHLSLQATFPQFAEVERAHGSLIRGMMTGKKPTETHTGTTRSAFLTFRQGLQSLIHGLVSELSNDVGLRTESEVSALHKLASGGYEVELSTGERLLADEVIVTSPAFVAANLLEQHVDTSALTAVNYVSVANVVLAFDKSEFSTTFEGSGFLVPRKEGRNITACTWTSTKWLHTSPDDKVLLRSYIGRSGEEDNVFLPDEELLKLVLRDLKELMGLTAQPLFSEITRLPKSMPQYPVGHLDNIISFEAELKQKLPGVYAVGTAFRGVGMPDAIKQARDLAATMADTK